METPRSKEAVHDPATATPTGYAVGDLEIDTVRERVSRGGEEIALPKLSFNLLAVLVKAAPDLVSIDSLLTQVWPRLVVGPETVSQRVKLVRTALGDDSKQPRYISSVRGRGYRVVAPVRPLESAGAAPGDAPHSVPVPSAAGAGAPYRRLRTAGAVLAALALAAVVFVSLPPRSATRGEQGPQRVAVLPFENLSPDPTDAFFADGMHDEIINALARQAPISVIARTTMMTYRDGPRRSAHEIAAELDATHVIAATLRRDPIKVKLTLQLVDARNDSVVWSRTYERELAEAVTLQTEVAAEIAAQFSSHAGTLPEPPRAMTANAEAYDAYLRALVARASATGIYVPPRHVVDGVEAYLTTAVELDPTFAPAYAERAAIRIATLWYNMDTSAEQLQRIDDDLAAAERLAPNDPKTLAGRAWHLMMIARDDERALAVFAAAEQAGLADPMWMLDVSLMLRDLGRTDEALRLAERALALDPRSAVAITYHAWHLSSMGRPLDALRTLDFGLAQSPADPALRMERGLLVFRNTGNVVPLDGLREPDALHGDSQARALDSAVPLARAFAEMRWSGRLDEYAKQLDAVPSATLRASLPMAGQEPVARLRGWVRLLRGDSAAADGRAVLEFLKASEETARNRYFRRLLAAEAYTFVGEPELAIAAAREAGALRPPHGYTVPFRFAIAAVYAWNGAQAEAVDLLQSLVSETPRVGPASVARDPLYTIPLAADARFRKLVARLESEMSATVLH